MITLLAVWHSAPAEALSLPRLLTAFSVHWILSPLVFIRGCSRFRCSSVPCRRRCSRDPADAGHERTKGRWHSVQSPQLGLTQPHTKGSLRRSLVPCFERLVMRHIKGLFSPSLDPLQFAYCSNRSTDDATTTTRHLSLSHLDNKHTYVCMLFIDFSSAFNTIIPQHLSVKLSMLGLNISICNWILDFLTKSPPNGKKHLPYPHTEHGSSPRLCA
ncbi:uncharacterized protein LOC108714724 isoform X1 [Xenopus laevis]|uniref:Uncharacterized protein LOC108714724 isoform X1 n=1 Tax=Xenopus laevis TaxID=8355 RepID=A0A8J1MZZ3_XENLA|nr:uncharacterized protein LOC108714724 isoform X1 [Xenopus laevis]